MSEQERKKDGIYNGSYIMERAEKRRRKELRTEEEEYAREFKRRGWWREIRIKTGEERGDKNARRQARKVRVRTRGAGGRERECIKEIRHQ